MNLKALLLWKIKEKLKMKIEKIVLGKDIKLIKREKSILGKNIKKMRLKKKVGHKFKQMLYIFHLFKNTIQKIQIKQMEENTQN